MREPLLGKRFRDVAVTSDRLAGTCFYLVSGHGGPDPGAIGRVGRHELHEDEYAYDIILRLARYLLSEGAEVRIIIQDAKDGIRGDAYLSNSKRETCMGDPIPLNQVARLQQRCDKINVLYAKTASATNIAVPSLSMSIVKGVASRWMFISTMRLEAGRESGWPMPCVPLSRPSMAFISPAVAYGTVSERGLYVLNHTTPVAVFVELGNIQNQSDLRRLVQPDNREALASGSRTALRKIMFQ